MEYDGQMEQRVWQRVRGEAKPMGLQGMATAEQSAAAVYLMLSRQVQGTEKNLLRQMFERERQHARCLGGIYLLQNGQRLNVRPVTPGNDRIEVALRKCYAQTLQAMKTYESLQEDAEYGSVFRRLCREEQEHCHMILQILGTPRQG